VQSRRRRRDAIGQAAEDNWRHFQLYLHGCQAFADDEATSSALQRHLVRTTAAHLMDWLLRYQVNLTPLSASVACCGIRKSSSTVCSAITPWYFSDCHAVA